MARTVKNEQLQHRTNRLELAKRNKPYWQAIHEGLHVGYRRTSQKWLVRIYVHDRKYVTQVIGSADDFAEANGTDVLDFKAAQKIANERYDEVRRGAAADKANTVAKVLDQYEADLETRRGDTGNVRRVRVHLPKALADKTVASLTAVELRAWRDDVAKRVTPATVNRVTSALKAALNLLANTDARIGNRHEWENGLASLPDAVESRNVILPEHHIRAIVHEASDEGEGFTLFVQVHAVTGARSSQIARLKVDDLQDRGAEPRLMMPVSRKGRGQKKLTHRPVPITAALTALLRLAAAGRAREEPLLIRRDGKPWRKSDHARPFAKAVRAAGLDPAVVTIYALRHSSIVRQLLAGVPVRVVAVNHDTSVAMIERTYSRYIGDHADALTRAALLDMAAHPGVVEDSNVTPMRSAR